MKSTYVGYEYKSGQKNHSSHDALTTKLAGVVLMFRIVTVNIDVLFKFNYYHKRRVTHI